MGLGVLGRELPVVRIGVARFALLWSALESRCVFGGGLVTFATNNGTMRAH